MTWSHIKTMSTNYSKLFFLVKHYYPQLAVIKSVIKLPGHTSNYVDKLLKRDFF